MTKTPPLVLASTSPYRRALLLRLGLPFTCQSPDIDESPQPGEAPGDLALRLALAKAQAAAREVAADCLIIGADQVAALGSELLGKPLSHDAAFRQLRRCAGQAVRFLTAVSVFAPVTGIQHSALDLTVVHFRPLSDAQIARYLDREPPYDCAGSFKAEGLGISLFERIDSDDPSGLIGLPLIRLVRLLAAFGVEIP